MSQAERPRNYSETFGLLKLSVQQRRERAQKMQEEIGQEIRSQIGVVVSTINEGILPESIFISDITPNNIRTPSVAHREQVRYFPSTNSLIVVDREVIKVEYNPYKYPFSRPSYFPLSEAEQTHEVIREIDEQEWLEYGEGVVTALEKAVKESQTAKK